MSGCVRFILCLLAAGAIVFVIKFIFALFQVYDAGDEDDFL